MKRRTFLYSAVLLSLCCPPLVTAQTDITLQAYDQGNTYLADGAFREAIEAYSAAEESGYASSALYHNMGLAYYRLDDLGRSILYLERAHRLAPDSEAISHSLSVASSRRQDQFSRIGMPFTKRAHQWIIRNIGLGGLLVLGISTYLAFMGLMIARILFFMDGPWWRRARTWTGFAAAAALVLTFYSSLRPAFDSRAVVLVDRVELREQPADSSSVVTTIHEGLVVTDVGDTDQWRLVQLPNGARGWLPATALERL